MLSQKKISKECLIISNNVTDVKESRIICQLKEKQRHLKKQIIDKICVSQLSYALYRFYIVGNITVCKIIDFNYFLVC